MDAIAVKDASHSRKEEWAREKGKELWREHDDPDIVNEMSEEENKEDKNKAWRIVWEENETELLHDLRVAACTEWVDGEGRVQYDDTMVDKLRAALETGFKNAYEKDAGLE